MFLYSPIVFCDIYFSRGHDSHQTKNKLLILNKLISPSYHALRGNSYRNAPAFRDAGASTHTFPRTAYKREKPSATKGSQLSDWSAWLKAQFKAQS